MLRDFALFKCVLFHMHYGVLYSKVSFKKPSRSYLIIFASRVLRVQKLTSPLHGVVFPV